MRVLLRLNIRSYYIFRRLPFAQNHYLYSLFAYPGPYKESSLATMPLPTKHSLGIPISKDNISSSWLGGLSSQARITGRRASRAGSRALGTRYNTVLRGYARGGIVECLCIGAVARARRFLPTRSSLTK